MIIRVNLMNQRFGKLVVIAYDKDKSEAEGKTYWICKCDCGNTISVLGSRLKNGTTKSCGCYKPNKRFTEIYMNEEKGYGVAFIRNKNKDGSFNDNYFVSFRSEDKDIVQNGAWKVNGDGYISGYARGSHTESKSVLLHRAIAERHYDIDGMLVDHIDHNLFNLNYDNLRPCTASQNALNRSNYCINPDKDIDMRNIVYNKKKDVYVVAFRVTEDDGKGSKKFAKSFKKLEDAKKYRDDYIANSPYKDFYYNPETDSTKNGVHPYEFRIDGNNLGMHPFHIYDRNDMPLPDPDTVIQPFTNMPSILQPIINPFEIVIPYKFNKSKI